MVLDHVIFVKMATWKPLLRDYDQERKLKSCKKDVVFIHPLKLSTITVLDVKTRKAGGKPSGKGSRSSSISSEKSSRNVTNPSFVDPLTTMFGESDPLAKLVSEAVDPLSKLATQGAADKHRKPIRETSPSMSELDETFEPWSARKAGILSRFTTSEKLSITTSFLSSSDKEKVLVKTQTSTVSDKVKNRLEQLDDFEEGSVREMLNLSQQEYVRRIEDLNNALIVAWDQDQRVKALKIAIQCSKMLADVSVILFYPSKFVLITEILDTFGKLVYNRIFQKSTYFPPGAAKPVPLPENFSPSQVPDSAKETCKNWFFKIASIRELIPRFYVEAAILKCYSYLAVGEYNDALKRLAVMCRGIGDPLVAVHARCYLCRVGINVSPGVRDHLMPCFDDFLTTYAQIQGDSVQNVLATQNLDLSEYLTLYSPGVDWILQCVAHKASEKSMVEVLDKSNKHCNSALLLNSIMSTFKPEFISSRAVEFTSMIKECEDSGFPKHLLYRSLGSCVSMAEPPEEHRLALLNDVWKAVMKLKEPADYIGCAEIWIEFVVRYFGKRELNTFLSDIIKHMTPDRAYEQHYPQLQSVVTKVMDHTRDFSMLFSLDKFMTFIDMFQKDSVQVEVCKIIMEAYIRHQTEPTNDPVILNALMFICKIMHDSVNALSLDDEIRVIGVLINGFIRSISFGRDFEQQLSFYVEARANFSSIDAVLVSLVQCVNSLAVKTRRVVKGNHNKKTAAFVRACAAYCFITIPSLHGVFTRLNLYLLSGEVALLNQCLSQGDAFFKAAISLISEVPRTLELDSKMRNTDHLLQEFVGNLLAALLTAPDNPDQEVLYLLRGLLNVLQSHPWDPTTDTKAYIYCNVLNLLSAYSQETYIYHAGKVDSNDAMYGSDPKFLAEVERISNTLLEELLGYIKSLADNQNQRRSALLSLQLLNNILAHGDLAHEQIITLSCRLWKYAERDLEAKVLARTYSYVKSKSLKPECKLYRNLLGGMTVTSPSLQALVKKM